MVAALSLNVFQRHADRVKMANIAQVANVLQSMVLTRGDKMVLTPTYYVFKMYTSPGCHHRYLSTWPLQSMRVRDNRHIDMLQATASQKDGRIAVSLTNLSLDTPMEVEIPTDGKARDIQGSILSAASIDDYNDFRTARKKSHCAL